MIGITPGDVELPELQLPWWNIDVGEWQIASLPGTSISILPSANAAVLPPVASEEPAPQQDASPGGTLVVASGVA
jgi:hypothetical protein